AEAERRSLRVEPAITAAHRAQDPPGERGPVEPLALLPAEDAHRDGPVRIPEPDAERTALLVDQSRDRARAARSLRRPDQAPAVHPRVPATDRDRGGASDDEPHFPRLAR